VVNTARPAGSSWCPDVLGCALRAAALQTSAAMSVLASWRRACDRLYYHLRSAERGHIKLTIITEIIKTLDSACHRCATAASGRTLLVGHLAFRWASTAGGQQTSGGWLANGVLHHMSEHASGNTPSLAARRAGCGGIAALSHSSQVSGISRLPRASAIHHCICGSKHVPVIMCGVSAHVGGSLTFTPVVPRSRAISGRSCI
jgi:hypothetical protein